jgi:DNA recombination protein RmuC
VVGEVLPWVALGVVALGGAALVFRTVREELREAREESRRAAAELRDEVAKRFEANSAALSSTLIGVTSQIKELQEGNERKLDQMRQVVDEKLQGTLEKRLGESFKLVSQQLEAVHKGLGDMQSLATGVGDLKRVLSNVKTRGVFGEVALGAILEQVLTPDQYAKNVRPRPESGETVEFAVRLPGPEGPNGKPVWLPLDAKFPHEDYGRLLAAVEAADAQAVTAAGVALERAVRLNAQSIRNKYVAPPHTTDFAILFVPTEGLYAELLRRAGFAESLQQDHRVLIAGPTTLAALLTSLRVGFRTLAIEQRASEVWKVLAAVKTEFGKFGEVLDKVKRQLQTASNTIDETGVRSRAIEKRLQKVEELPPAERTLFDLPESSDEPRR